MSAASSRVAPSRGAPQQQRSRDKLALVLDAAERLLGEQGYDAFTTTAVAARAGLPASTIYRWFADKDEIATALMIRHTERLDAQTTRALDALDDPSVEDAVRTVYDVYVAYYREHRSHGILWFEGRVGATAVARVREHTRRVAAGMRAYAVARGLFPERVTELDVLVMTEAVDRIHELAFRDDPNGDDDILARGLALAQTYYRGLAA